MGASYGLPESHSIQRDWSQRPLPSAPEDLSPGQLLFFARPSPLQTWAEAFGHEWRHVGVTVQTSDGLRVASYGPKKCFRMDDPAAIMHNYDRVGVAWAVATEAELRDLEQFCRRHEHLERSDSPYTFTAVLFGPIHLAARRMPAGALRRVLFALIWLYCALQDLRYRNRSAYCCSTFVWAALAAARREMLRVPLSAHPEDLAAYATVANRTDELFARWLCGPTELWQAIAEADRRELELVPSHVEVVPSAGAIDLTRQAVATH